jgi:hypothetical protein
VVARLHGNKVHVQYPARCEEEDVGRGCAVEAIR